MRLSFEASQNAVARSGQPIEPGRYHRQRCRETWSLKDQESANHLDPGCAALRPGADHNIARPKREIDPTTAVLVGGDIPYGNFGQRVRVTEVRFQIHSWLLQQC